MKLTLLLNVLFRCFLSRDAGGASQLAPPSETKETILKKLFNVMGFTYLGLIWFFLTLGNFKLFFQLHNVTF